MIVALGVALGGGVGAGLRWLADVLLSRQRRRSPWPILLVNVIGCFAFAALTATFAPGSEIVAVVGTGVLGGFTTFSTVSVDTAQLWRARRRALALANAGGTLLTCGLAAAAGLAVI